MVFGPTQQVNGLLSTSIKQRYSQNENKLKDVSSEDICLAQLELNSVNNKQKLEDDNLNISEDQNTEWQILDAFKIRFMNTRIFWIVTVHVVVGLYIWLMS